MKFIFYLFAIIFSSSTAFGQVWVDSDAQWTYEILDDGNPGRYEYEYVSDTLIEGHNCQKITGVRQQYFLSGGEWEELPPVTLYENYTYVSGDTIFYYFNDQFFVLYDFGATVGDQWLIADTIHSATALCNDSSFVEVVETGSMDINDVTYRTITLKTLENSSYGLDGLYIERFGFIPDSSRFRLFPFPISCNDSFIIQPWYLQFRCFYDSSFEIYNPSGEDCLHTPSTASLPIESDGNRFNMYPNPASNQVNLGTTFSGLITILDQSGRTLKNLDIQNQSFIDISDLANGTYFVVFSQDGKQVDLQSLVLIR